MLVNTIAFYPRPLRVVEPAALVNDNAFGAPVVRHDAVAGCRPPSSMRQSFGRRRLAVTRRYLQPTAGRECPKLWRQPDPAARAALTWARRPSATRARSARTGSRRKLTATAVLERQRVRGAYHRRGGEEVQLFQHARGRQPHRHASPSRSAASRLAAARHRSSSTARPRTSSGGTAAAAPLSRSTSAPRRSSSRRAGNRAIRPRMAPSSGRARTTVRPIPTSAARSRSVARPSRSTRRLIDNATAYRYYRLTQTAGSTSASPFLQEVEFYIEGDD